MMSDTSSGSGTPRPQAISTPKITKYEKTPDVLWTRLMRSCSTREPKGRYFFAGRRVSTFASPSSTQASRGFPSSNIFPRSLIP